MTVSLSTVREQLDAIRGLDLSSGPDSGADISQVESGGYLDISGETYKVEAIHRYLDVKWSNYSRRKSEYWVTEIELCHLPSMRTVYIEWEIDDQLEVYLTDRMVSLRSITVGGRSVSRSMLDRIVEEEEGSVFCNGQEFHYEEDDTWAALFYRANSAEPLKVRMLEFSSNDASCLTIELWDNEEGKPEREAFISHKISAKSVKVLQRSIGGNR